MTVANEARFLDRSRAAIETNLGQLTKDGEAAIAELERIASERPSADKGRKLPGVTFSLELWLQTRGLHRLFEGDKQGWQDIRDVVLLQRWDGQVLEAAYQRTQGPDRFRVDLTATAFSDALLALHVGDAESAHFTMQRLAAQSREPEGHNWRFKTGALMFQARLYEHLTGQSANLAWDQLPALGLYEALLRNDQDEKQYAAALASGCTEHLAQTTSRKGEVATFAAGPFAPLPIELMSWLRYRRAQGLSHHTGGHPLLESPLASLDPPAATTSPIAQLIERCRPHYAAYLNGSS